MCVREREGWEREREREREKKKRGVCVRANMLYRLVFTLLLVRYLFLIFNCYVFKLLVIFLLVDEFLSLYNITDL